ncbi:hypothetical protein BTO04_12090 [Polaribacter sp. SA4-10]|nr:hypothetical protein BTO04_12090 [Polaribacter sp. SA4-10]
MVLLFHVRVLIHVLISQKRQGISKVVYKGFNQIFLGNLKNVDAVVKFLMPGYIGKKRMITSF